MKEEKSRMVDKNLLYSKVVCNGDNWKILASRLGIYTATLHSKLRGVTPFKDVEIQQIMKLYNLTADEVVAIFLTKGVA